MPPPKRKPGLIPSLIPGIRNQIGRQIIDRGKQVLMYKAMNEIMKKREIQKSINSEQHKKANPTLALNQGFRSYHRLPRTMQAALDAKLTDYMTKIGVEGKEAKQTVNMKKIENLNKIRNRVKGLQAKYGIQKINEQRILAQKILALERKGIPRELAQQFALLWTELLKGSIRDPVAFRNMIKKINQKFVFEIQGQKIPAESFLNKKELNYLNEYSKAFN